MPSPPEARHVRAALLLSIGLGVIGVFGVTNALGALAMQSTRPSPPPPTADPAQDATAAFFHATQTAMLDAPYATALASMHLVVSAMLVIGSFMLSSRSPNATWWVRNATVANALYVVLDTTSITYELARRAHRLEPLLRAAMEASAEGAALPPGAPTTSSMLVSFVVTGTALAIARLLVQALLYWRIGSEPVRAFLAPSE